MVKLASKKRMERAENNYKKEFNKLVKEDPWAAIAEAQRPGPIDCRVIKRGIPAIINFAEKALELYPGRKIVYVGQGSRMLYEATSQIASALRGSRRKVRYLEFNEEIISDIMKKRGSYKNAREYAARKINKKDKLLLIDVAISSGTTMNTTVGLLKELGVKDIVIGSATPKMVTATKLPDVPFAKDLYKHKFYEGRILNKKLKFSKPTGAKIVKKRKTGRAVRRYSTFRKGGEKRAESLIFQQMLHGAIRKRAQEIRNKAAEKKPGKN